MMMMMMTHGPTENFVPDNTGVKETECSVMAAVCCT